ncbi:conserved hypothetical protein [Rhizobiales bacterium GAS113]|nr:conserved hypothetical protein [Rhizobiales bacterium GAS113]
MRFLRRSLFALVVAGLTLAIATILTRRAGDPSLYPPRPEDTGITVHVTAYSYHSGLVLPLPELKEVAERLALGEVIAIADRFRAYAFVEIGWGDEGFYRLVPTVAELTAREALRALLRPNNPSVLHVVGLARAPVSEFSGIEVAPITLSRKGFDRLVSRLAESIAAEDGRPIELGTGLYGPSLFYRARGAFNIFNVCNHWVAGLLNAAGLPTLPVLDTLPAGLLLDLSWVLKPPPA